MMVVMGSCVVFKIITSVDVSIFNELHTPDYQALGEAMGVKSWKVGSAEEFRTVIQQAVDFQGPSVIELDMHSIGPLNFAGPPHKKLY